MSEEVARELRRHIETLPVISTHEHHRPDEYHRRLTLDEILKDSYVSWLGFDPGQGPDSRAAYLAEVRHNSYFVWLEKGITRIYGLDGKITPGNWDELSGRIARRHRSPAAHIDILRQVGRYRRAIQDSYFDYHSDVGHPELFAPTLRTDMFVRCFHPDVNDHDGMSPLACYPQTRNLGFEDYLEFLGGLFSAGRNTGAVALKSASAYEMALDYGEPDYAAAGRVWNAPPEEVTIDDRRKFEETMFHWFCRLAARLELPFQIHTGLGQLSGSRPCLFEPSLLRHPDVHFVLFHAGYPWWGETAGLLHNYANVSVDMVWAPIISTNAAVAALHEYLEVARSSRRIAWGSDTWTSEEAIGALLAWEHVVCRVLSEKVEQDYFDMDEACELSERLMWGNAARLYRL